MSACRTCGRDFNPLWRRGKNCGHCGYEYCSNCMEGHALMPRTAVRQQARNSGPFTEIRDALMGALENPTTPGYDVEPLCTNCHGMMQGESDAGPANVSHGCTARHTPVTSYKAAQGISQGVRYRCNRCNREGRYCSGGIQGAKCRHWVSLTRARELLPPPECSKEWPFGRPTATSSTIPA